VPARPNGNRAVPVLPDGAIAAATTIGTALRIGAIGGPFAHLPVVFSSVRSAVDMSGPRPTPHAYADAALVVPAPSTAAADA